jgi:hypothetical protein
LLTGDHSLWYEYVKILLHQALCDLDEATAALPRPVQMAIAEELQTEGQDLPAEWQLYSGLYKSLMPRQPSIRRLSRPRTASHPHRVHEPQRLSSQEHAPHQTITERRKRSFQLRPAHQAVIAHAASKSRDDR